ncbi:MAG TPA: cytochrome c oxidase subunit 3, partial [Candidatus Methylomirabilis sp.]|nr:cytochrome c oxidase subunit 3 [Candidatus Methylomirabilis sp.]
MSSPSAEHHDPSVAFESAKLGVWTFLATEVLLFGALFTAYAVFRMKYPELFRAEHAKLDRVLGAANTVVLITSSFTVVLGVDAIRRGKPRRLEACFGATILLAGVFLCVKYVEYAAKFHHGLYPGTNLFFSL